MKKSTRREIARDTLQIIKQGYYHNSDKEKIHITKAQKAAERNTRFYTPEELSKLVKHQAAVNGNHDTEFEVNDLTTFDAVRKAHAEGEENIMALNFASAKNPGGGFLGGAQAQEESITRASGLYPCLLEGKPYYVFHRTCRTCLYSDRMIYAPKVPIFKDEDGKPLDDFVPVSIITSPAVNAGVVRRQEPQNIDKIEPTQRTRISKMLALAAEHGHETLVLGAWGCGVFQNDPEDMAQWFKDALEGDFKGKFRKVIFAVYSKNERFITPFRELF